MGRRCQEGCELIVRDQKWRLVSDRKEDWRERLGEATARFGL